LVAPDPNAEKRAKNYFKRALAVARSSKQNLGNCALRRVWRGSGAIRANTIRLTSFSLQSTAGLPKASTRSI
jgi:hypothetical protein